MPDAIKPVATRRLTCTAENDVLRDLFESSPEALLVFDTANTSVVEANKSFLDLTGLEPDHLPGSPLADLDIFEPEDLRTILAALARSPAAEFDRVDVRLAGRQSGSCRILLRKCLSGARSYAELRLSDLAQRARRVDEVQRQNELLEQRVAERTAELEQTNQELEAFSYSVSHDLRAPLRHVLGFAGILQREAGKDLSTAQRSLLERITSAAGRMNELIDDLLAFSHIGRSELHKRAVDLAALLRAVREDLRGDAEGRDIEWIIGPLPVVQADHSLLRQAMVNLVSNALKFTAPRKKARIEIGSSEVDPRETVVYVRDNGVGFDQRHAGKLFGVFQRLHHGSEFAGTGIGLANVRQIIRRHGGRVWAEGTPGKGATFYFSLPRAEADIR